MKLARVTHVRCHERSWRELETLVWVDAEMTMEEFQMLVNQARDAYDKAGKDFEAAERPPYRGWGPDYAKQPNRTVAEVKAEHEAAVALYRAWEAKKREAQANFAHHLKAVSSGRIVQFWEKKLPIDVLVQWGHRHGQRIAYGETALKDLPGSVEREDDWA